MTEFGRRCKDNDIKLVNDLMAAESIHSVPPKCHKKKVVYGTATLTLTLTLTLTANANANH